MEKYPFQQDPIGRIQPKGVDLIQHHRKLLAAHFLDARMEVLLIPPIDHVATQRIPLQALL